MDDESSREERSTDGSTIDRDPVAAAGSDEQRGASDGSAADGGGSDPGVEEQADGERTDGKEADEDDLDGSVAGEFVPKVPVEPGRPELENALFVVAGAFLTVLAIAALVAPDAFTLRGMAVLVGAAAVATIVAFAFFGVLDPDT